MLDRARQDYYLSTCTPRRWCQPRSPHDWTFVTRNAADVERTGVRLLDPFGE